MVNKNSRLLPFYFERIISCELVSECEAHLMLLAGYIKVLRAILVEPYSEWVVYLSPKIFLAN